MDKVSPDESVKGDAQFETERRSMVEKQLKGRDIKNPMVLNAMGKVKRHSFVSEAQQGRAYGDFPLPIGNRQTISQPYIVALMTQLGLGESTTAPKRILEVGTGSGYQAAVLAELVGHVYSIEIVCELAESAQAQLEKLNYKNITIKCGDGYQGWEEHAPFDMILVTAAPDHVPEPLKKQLAIGGRLVIPVGDYYQELLTITRTSSDKFTTKMVIPVRFVPMTGKAQEKE